VNQALIRRNDASLTVDFTEAALAMKQSALASAALVGKVSNADEQEQAVVCQTEIASLLNMAEKARKVCKDPVLEYGRSIDDKAREFVSELKEEQLRLARLVGDFQQLEQARVRAAQQAENERLLALEREKAKELAKAETHEQFDAIQEKFNQRAQFEAPPPEAIAPARASGQRVTEDWEIIVTDVWLLAKSHPTCVKIEPRLSEIKGLLNAGVKVAGVKAERQVKAGVRVGRPAAAIEV
jgi:hypothetical protein